MPDVEQRGPVSGHIVIVGPMGSGKTTLGRALASALDREFCDSDRSILERSGRSGREIAGTDGVDALHILEKAVLLEALASPTPAVIAAAASVIEDPAVRPALGDTYCVWVTADSRILAQRSGRGSHRRAVSASEHLERRDPLFEEVADLVVDTGVLSEQESVDRVMAAVAQGEPG